MKRYGIKKGILSLLLILLFATFRHGGVKVQGFFRGIQSAVWRADPVLQLQAR